MKEDSTGWVDRMVEHAGSAPGMDKITVFWSGRWEDGEKTTYQLWMIEVEQKITQKVEDVREFLVRKDDISMVIKKDGVSGTVERLLFDNCIML